MKLDEIGSDLYFDEGDEFAQTEMDYVDNNRWDDLLSLYEQELEQIKDPEDAGDLRNRIEAIRKSEYEDAQNAEKY
jgi:hypothetical protein